MRILSFVGTRPEIIKTLAFCRAAPRFPEIEFLVAHTGQNFGAEMADRFVEELGIPLADQNPSVIRASLGSVAQGLIDYIAECIHKYSPQVVVSNTDTDSAFYTALVGSKLRVPVAHIEGGIRCEARLNPEEINRRLADHLANWVFTISEEDTRSLLGEGFSADCVFMLGDITLDALKVVMREHGIREQAGDYDLLTVHRQENANDPTRLAAIIEGVERAGVPTVFPIHPRTRGTLQSACLLDRLRHSKCIDVREPLGYVDMLRLAAGCRKVLSDSGGLRREAYMLDKPVISLVSFVWFHKLNDLGYEFSAGADTERIAWAIQEFDPPGPRPALFGDGRAAEYILAKLLDLNP